MKESDGFLGWLREGSINEEFTEKRNLISSHVKAIHEIVCKGKTVEENNALTLFSVCMMMSIIKTESRQAFFDMIDEFLKAEDRFEKELKKNPELHRIVTKEIKKRVKRGG
jgi:pyruvate/2-oxoacid:ferredoxin oxidoreductase beta subunit